MPDDFRMAAAKPRQPLAVQHIDAANRVGDHGMPMAAMLEQRHLAEEIAFMQLDGLSRHHANRGVAAADEIHRPASIARGHDRWRPAGTDACRAAW